MPGKYAYAVIRWMIQRIDDTINHCNLTLNRAGNQHVAEYSITKPVLEGYS